MIPKALGSVLGPVRDYGKKKVVGTDSANTIDRDVEGGGGGKGWGWA